MTNIGEGDHLGLNDIDTPEELAKVKRCIVDVVPPDGTAVLNADDPLVVAMEPHCAGKIFYFALDEQPPGHRPAPQCGRAGDLRPRQHHRPGRRRTARSRSWRWIACR